MDDLPQSDASPAYPIPTVVRSSVAPYLFELRRIILEKLGHSLLQVHVVLIRVFLKIEGFDGVSAPDQLLSYPGHTGSPPASRREW